jgi:hypothetical protein
MFPAFWKPVFRDRAITALLGSTDNLVAATAVTKAPNLKESILSAPPR